MIAMIRYAVPSIMMLAGASLVHSEPRQELTPLYAADRIEAAFAAVSEADLRQDFTEQQAVKSDLPPGCVGPFRPDIQAECIDSAYELGSDPRVIVEARIGSTSILTRRFEDGGAALLAETARNWPLPSRE
jgi:hypothetical protein